MVMSQLGSYLQTLGQYDKELELENWFVEVERQGKLC